MAYRPKDDWRQSFLDGIGRTGLTLLIVFFLLLLSVLPLGLHGYGNVRPAFLLMAVYYWSVYRPYMLSPVGTFAAGIVLDLLTGGPVGLQALLLVAARTLTVSQQKFMLAQKFIVMWAFFGLVALGAGLLQWALTNLIDQQLTELQPVLFSVLLSTLLFPAIALPLFLLNRAMDSRDIFR